ncbi:MAG: enoyl-CoA hydratase/isomerase family protein [Alphaproteobacteria bacterium]|jgi:enoyl-CoA hydratase|nr:enoyl-CoA hydratase/isomerase family protein [Alphaproteobacteria bacterium]MDP6566259.1 enoyl-CoA hydratase/isomerase family protein [Alphaproteobacteria bacterium]MDP6814651.1 enoyl-CoA hydratase/isomerase family protein [Alphaproteobacteria bacterium]
MPEEEPVFANIELAFEPPLALITLNRPADLNPLDWGTIRELRAAVAAIEARAGVRVVIVTGAGRAFSAGGDMKGYVGLFQRPDDCRAFLRDFFELCAEIESSERIYIAAVNGITVAGGLELLLACDLVLVAEAARIGDGHLKFAMLPGAGSSQRLPRAIGRLRAMDLILTARLIDGVEAERIGLASRSVPGERLMDEARELAAGLAENSPVAIKGAKYLVNEGLKGSLLEGLELEIDYAHRYATEEPDAMEGLRAFAEKRKPRYGDG